MDSDTLVQIIGIQSTSFHELQSQAHRILRSLIAVFALSIAFTQTQYFYSLLNLQIPEKEIEVAGGGATLTGFYQSFAEYHFLMAVALFGVFLALLLDSGVWAYRVLRTPPIQPGMTNQYNTSVSLKVATGSLNSGDFAGWIQSNQEILEKCHHRIQNSYRRVTESAPFLLLSLTIVWAIYNGQPQILVFVDAIIVLAGTIFPLYYLRTLLSSVSIGWKTEGKTARKELKQEYLSLERNTPSLWAFYMITALIIPTYFVAIFSTIIWSHLVVFG